MGEDGSVGEEPSVGGFGHWERVGQATSRQYEEQSDG